VAARRRIAILLILGLAGLAGLAGCGMAPPLASVAPAAPPALTVAGAEGPLPLSRWPAAGEPVAVILGVHGFGFLGETAFRIAGPYWAARGVEVYAYDQRGFGRNPDRGDWPGEDALIADLAAVARAVRALHPRLPLFVVGHSMGGGVALAAAGEGRLPEAAGIVALAPAVWGADTLPLPYRAAAWLAAGLLPEQRWSGEGVVAIRPTDNLRVLRAVAGDPLHIGHPSSRETLGLIRLMDRAIGSLPQLGQPVLIVAGAKDEVVPEAPIRAAWEAVRGPKTFARAEQGWHMLLHDLQAWRVFDLVLGWIAETAAAARPG
jgi:alpha-beta hydrolase superfamily lysophospholipase